ncbi:MAG: lysyl oxidase family protein, partial [Phycisphaerales bacterium]|nr:lysyl oxidase family protein [Phycisphaerales bacterium]
MAGVASSSALAHPPGDLLPDIIASTSHLYDNEIRNEGGRRVLRLSNGTPNIGDGPLHLYGGQDLGNGTQEVIQRIFRDDGTFTDRVAGSFIYHPTHNHIHVENWCIYRLREVLPEDGVGDIIAEGAKTSFCVLDLGLYDSSLPNFDPSPNYTSCGSTTQGLSVGWLDVYSKGLDGQLIDITGVPDGEYWLESQVDPDDAFVELDETNNFARIKVSIGGTSTIQPDAYEPNNSFSETAARPVGAPSSPNLGPAAPQLNVGGLTIDSDVDADFFRFYMPATGTSSDFVRIDFIHGQG